MVTTHPSGPTFLALTVHHAFEPWSPAAFLTTYSHCCAEAHYEGEAPRPLATTAVVIRLDPGGLTLTAPLCAECHAALPRAE